MKGINVYILKNIQYVEVENNSPGVSNREKLRLYYLKSRKDFPFLLLCSIVLCYFNRSVVFICFLCHVFVFNLPLQ